jgi:hypothetical protein
LFCAIVMGLLLTFGINGLPYGRFGAANKAWAEEYTVGSSGSSGDFNLIGGHETLNFTAPPFNGPTDAAPAGVFKATGFNNYSVNTAVGLGIPCQFVRAYRVTPNGDMILHPTTCVNGSLQLQSVGTGHYVLFAFSSPASAALAQHDVLLSHNP